MAGLDIAPVVRSQDYTIIKQNEDNKALVDQANIGQVMDQKQTTQNTGVVSTSESEWYEGKADADKEGSGGYAGDGGSKRKKKPEQPFGRVIVKGRQTGFDLKI